MTLKPVREAPASRTGPPASGLHADAATKPGAGETRRLGATNNTIMKEG